MFFHFEFWSGDFFLITHFPDVCLPVPFYVGPDLKLCIVVGWAGASCLLLAPPGFNCYFFFFFFSFFLFFFVFLFCFVFCLFVFFFFCSGFSVSYLAFVPGFQ